MFTQYQCSENQKIPMVFSFTNCNVVSNISLFIKLLKLIRLVMAQEIKYLIFSFLRSGNKAKHDVEFHHLRSNPSRIRWKEGNGNVLMGTECLKTRFLGSLCLPCYVQYIPWSFLKNIYYYKVVTLHFFKCHLDINH